MPLCPSCRRDNPEGYRFCGQCGAGLSTSSCPSCAAVNPYGQPFCGQCGTGLGTATNRADPSPTPVEERKLATVLFADVVGFTSLAERIDPEALSRMVDSAFLELAAVVGEHGGTVDKYMGDSLMAVFGVPLSHDDDAERAVAAALAMRRLGGDLVFAIGVNTGEVMVGAPGGGDTTVIGDAVNVAARLEKAAAPGEVLCGRLTVELARRRVEFEERQAVVLKGKRQPVEVWAALRLRRGSEATAPAADRTPMVGRQEELAFLDNQARRVRQDSQSALVVVCGEAGSGKTRLLDELAERVGHGARVVAAAYPGYGVLGGRQVAAELIDQLGPSADPEVERRVRSVLGEHDPSLRTMDAASIEREQVWGLGRLVKEKTSEQPLVVLIDDLHGADDQTLDLIGQLAVFLRDQPLLTVVAGRTEPAGWLARFAAATTLRLRPLTGTQSEELAAMLVGGTLDDDARSFFTDRAKGNPLFLRELVAVARERGALVEDSAVHRLHAERVVPASLQALLAARLDALDRHQKAAFQHLALLGEATAGELEALGDSEDASALAGLVERGLVRQGPSTLYEPADPLLGEVAYDMLPRATRGELHRRAASVVGRPEGRLRHLERASEYLADDAQLTSEAAEALAAEGLAMIEGFRHVDALRLLERSVALGMRRPDVLLALAPVQAVCGKSDEALETLALIPDDNDDEVLMAERDHTAANVKTFVDPAWAAPRLLDAADRWRHLGNIDKEAWAHANAGLAHIYMSQMAQSARLLERSLELFEAVGDRAGAVAASSFLCLARPEDPRVEGWLTDALAFADETGDRNRQATALVTLTWRHFFRSLTGGAQETAVAEDFAVRLTTLAHDLLMVDMAVHGHSLRALMARGTGRWEQARTEIGPLSGLHGSSGQRQESWLAWSAAFAVALATESPDAAAPFPPEQSVDPVVAVAAMVLEGSLVMAGRVEEALARRQQRTSGLQGALADVGTIFEAVALVLAGDTLEARPLLERVEKAAQVLDSLPVARAAGALLAEIDGRLPDVGALPTGPSVSGALVLRARAAAGQPGAAQELRAMTEQLGAPGLLIGLR